MRMLAFLMGTDAPSMPQCRIETALLVIQPRPLSLCNPQTINDEKRCRNVEYVHLTRRAAVITTARPLVCAATVGRGKTIPKGGVSRKMQHARKNFLHIEKAP